jgi:hypothetical protein
VGIGVSASFLVVAVAAIATDFGMAIVTVIISVGVITIVAETVGEKANVAVDVGVRNLFSQAACAVIPETSTVIVGIDMVTVMIGCSSTA